MRNIRGNITFSKLTLWFLLIIMFLSFISLKRWDHANTQQKLIAWDVTSYYCYLPAAFIHHDISLDFTRRGADKSYELNHQYWYQTAPNGSRVIKFTMGMAVMYSPFFFLAHASALLFKYEPDGFSTPYEFFIALSSLVYLFIGLLYLRKTLLLFYSEKATGITLLCVLLGTNLYYYTTSEPAMSHAYSFAVVAGFIYQAIQWHTFPSIKRSIYLGLLFGLIVLIRPVNIVLVVFPLLFAVYSKQSFMDKNHFLWENKKQLIIIGVISFLVFTPQLIYWKYLTGQWFFYSYLEEHFYFNKPHVLLGLFSFRNGWLVYTPVMIFALVGILLLNKSNKNFSSPLLVFVSINVYVCYSWWTWWYGGSFGSRPMIDSYALMAIPMACFFELIISKSKLLSASLLTILFLLISLNLFQSYQRKMGIIHWDSMTAKAYAKVFLKSELSDEDKIQLEPLLFHPDYDKAKAGDEE